jgi:glycosyltransferase involved in cell wall biosynthesis
MKILFDLSGSQGDGVNTYDGGAEYTKVIFFSLSKKLSSDHFCILFNSKKNINSDIKRVITNKCFPLFDVNEHKSIEELIRSLNISKFICPMPYILSGEKIFSAQVYITIHGLRPIELPTDKYEYVFYPTLKRKIVSLLKYSFTTIYLNHLKKSFQQLLSISDNLTIIAVSNHTKYAILNYFPKVKPINILVKYSPSKILSEDTTVSSDYLRTINLDSKKYFLLISGKRWSKNAYRAIKAFDHLFSERPELDFKVMVLGTNPDMFNNSVRNRDRFVFEGYVDSSVLEYLYRNAYCFVYPTLNEGFGYPPLEAMKYGVPVIASAITSVLEVCENSALYFNPYSIDEIKNRILQVYYDHKKHSQLSKSSLIHSALMAEKQKKDLEELIYLFLSE